MNNELKHKTIREGLNAQGAPFFIYRIQGGVWARHYEGNQYYISVPIEVMQAVKKEVERVFAGKDYLKKSLEYFQTTPYEKDGKVYDTVCLGAKAYDENAEQLGDNAYLQDVAIRFYEFTYQKKHGIAKSILQFVKAERSTTNYLAQDDYFDDVQGEHLAAAPEVHEETHEPEPYVISGDLPF